MPEAAVPLCSRDLRRPAGAWIQAVPGVFVRSRRHRDRQCGHLGRLSRGFSDGDVPGDRTRARGSRAGHVRPCAEQARRCRNLCDRSFPWARARHHGGLHRGCANSLACFPRHGPRRRRRAPLRRFRPRAPAGARARRRRPRSLRRSLTRGRPVALFGLFLAGALGEPGLLLPDFALFGLEAGSRPPLVLLLSYTAIYTSIFLVLLLILLRLKPPLRSQQ